jgi:cytochrome oxidase Cu insertion factor (SCO1/SenC/PrrC family)
MPALHWIYNASVSVTGTLRFVWKMIAGGGGGMLKPGDAAPEFDVTDHNGRRVKLSDYRGKKVVLWFYPKASTPG